MVYGLLGGWPTRNPPLGALDAVTEMLILSGHPHTLLYSIQII